MQDPNNTHSRKRWYQRAMDMATTQWKTSKTTIISKPTTTTTKQPPPQLWRNISTKATSSSLDHQVFNSSPSNKSSSTTTGTSSKLRKCTSLRVATSFTRVCLCAPISSYNYEVFRADYVPPRRSYSYPRSSTSTSKPARVSTTELGGGTSSSRRIFRGKSLTDDVLMRRFVVEEEAMMQVKRKNQMEVIRSRNIMRRKKLGPSPLSRMVLAQGEEY